MERIIKQEIYDQDLVLVKVNRYNEEDKVRIFCLKKIVQTA